MASNSRPSGLRQPTDLTTVQRLRDTFSHTPAIDALLSSLSGQQVPPVRQWIRRSRQGSDALLPAEAIGRDDFVLKAVVAYRNGSTQQQIATELGVHVQAIRTKFRDAGVKLNERNTTFTDDELRTIRRLRADGVSARELGRRYSAAHTTILRQSR